MRHRKRTLCLAGRDGLTSCGGRADGQMGAKPPLGGLSEDVGGRVPEDLLALLGGEVEEGEGRVGLEGAREIPELVVDLGDDGALGQALADATHDLQGRGLPGGADVHLSIGQGDVDALAGLLGDDLLLGVPQLVEEGETLCQEGRRRTELELAGALGRLGLRLLGGHGDLSVCPVGSGNRVNRQ